MLISAKWFVCGVVSSVFRMEAYSNLLYLLYVERNTIFLGPKSDSQWFLWILAVPCTCPFWNASLDLELVVSYMGFISSINIAITFFPLWGSDAVGQAYEPARLKLGGYGMWKIQTSSQIHDHELWTAPRPYFPPMEIFSKHKTYHE